MSRAPKPVNVKNVYAKESNIANGGQGLFLRHPLRRGEIICSYAGRLFDASEAKFRDPTYMVNFELGRGFKLDGDDVDGDLGHYANATRRNEAGVFTPPVNAAISLRGKAQWSSIDAKTGEVVCRGRFDLVARSDLQSDDEVILDYGKGYWKTMMDYIEFGPPARKPNAVARSARASRRNMGYYDIVKQSEIGSVPADWLEDHQPKSDDSLASSSSSTASGSPASVSSRESKVSVSAVKQNPITIRSSTKKRSAVTKSSKTTAKATKKAIAATAKRSSSRSSPVKVMKRTDTKPAAKQNGNSTVKSRAKKAATLPATSTRCLRSNSPAVADRIQPAASPVQPVIANKKSTRKKNHNQ